MKTVMLLLWACLISNKAFSLSLLGPPGLALGGAGRAHSQSSVEFHLLNPANMVQDTQFAGSAFYVYPHSDWGISAMERAKFPVAFSFLKNFKNKDNLMVLSTASPLKKGWSLGVSVLRWSVNEDAKWNFNVGTLIRPAQSPFGLAANWDAVLAPKEGPFEGVQKLGLGLYYAVVPSIRLLSDALWNKSENQWSLMFGSEIIIAGFLELRGGAKWPVIGEMQWLFSGGIGFTAEHISLDYSLSQSKKPDNGDVHLVHSLGIRGRFSR